MLSRSKFLLLISGLLLPSISSFAATVKTTRYALILQDEPAVKLIGHGIHRNSFQVQSARAAIKTKQAALRTQLESQGFHVTGSVATLLNAVFVKATPADVPRLQSLPGVKYVAPLRTHIRPKLNVAVNLVDATNAWTALGGIPNAGSGLFIAILDTGIDQTHPAFQDSTLTTPSGFPKCDTSADCAFATNKIIAVRSYVAELDGAGDAATSFPDDTSPDDRVGHGTAVAMCAGGNTAAGPLATITGLAPHAWLGNYKIYGSPGINDGSSDDVIISALDDAFNDYANIANLSSGELPFSGPLDTGATCGNPAGEACDPLAAAVENAVISTAQNGAPDGMIVVVAGGNDGEDTNLYPTLNTISSPSDAPDAISVGATDNQRTFSTSVQIAGPNAPADVQTVTALPSADAPLPSNVLTGPAIDAGKVGDEYGCSSFPAGSMTGDIALIERGASNGSTGCLFSTKVANAQAAGAIGVIIYDDIVEPLFPIGTGPALPVFFIGNQDGLDIKAYIDANPSATASLNPNQTAVPTGDANAVVAFSSHGPNIGNYAIKPDLVATGANIYTAAQDIDPNGEVYDPSRFILTQGTSFSTPIVAGITALVVQKNTTFTPQQVHSAVVNTANNTVVTDPYYTGTAAANPLSAGGGLVDANAAISTSVTSIPSTLSFGVLTSGFSTGGQTFSLTNAGSAPVTLSISQTTPDSATHTSLSATTVAAGQTTSITLTLSGSLPAPGIYYGNVVVTGGAVPFHIPYMYLVSDNTPANVLALSGDDAGFSNIVGQSIIDGALYLKVVDQYGIGLQGVPVTWSAPDGGSIDPTQFDSSTDQNGLAGAVAYLGSVPGTYTYFASVQGYTAGFTFYDSAIDQPTIAAGGVVNAASSVVGNGIAPGSYVSIYGSNFSVDTNGATYTPLPIAIYDADGLSYTSVGFDAIDSNGSFVEAPGPLTYVSPVQINVQVPWELAGQSSVQIKVDYEPINGNLITVPVTTYSPAMFAYSGQPAALDANYNLIGSSNPATRGQVIQIYCNGLGPVSNTPADGASAVASPLSEITGTLPVVTIGGQNAAVGFAGLAPGFAGLYQLNVTVPTGIGTGSQPVTLSIGGVAAPSLSMYVQ